MIKKLKYDTINEVVLERNNKTEMQNENKKIFKAAIFDLDGTVADTMGDLCISMNEMLRKVGYPERSKDELLALINNGPYAFVAGALPERYQSDEDEIERCVAIYSECYNHHYNDTTYIFDGITESLTELKQNGVKLALNTNKGQLHAEAIIEKLLPGIFDIVLGSGRFQPKPDPTGSFYIADSFSVSPDEFIFVGDSNVDMKTAKNAGMYAVGVNWGYRSEKVLLDSGADVIVSRPKQISDIVLGR